MLEGWHEWTSFQKCQSWEEKTGPQKTGPGHSLYRERAEYCFESTVSEERTHWVLRQGEFCEKLGEFALAHKKNRLRGTHWARSPELGEPKTLTELGVWNRTPRNCIRPVSDSCTSVRGPPVTLHVLRYTYHSRTPLGAGQMGSYANGVGRI